MTGGLRPGLLALRHFGRAALQAAADRAGNAARQRLDDLAFLWLMNRERLPRAQAAELLERLGAELGAKIEIQAPLRPR